MFTVKMFFLLQNFNKNDMSRFDVN